MNGLFDELAEPLCIRDVEVKKNAFGIVALKTVKGSMLRDIADTLTYNDWLSLVEFSLGFLENLRQQQKVYLNFHPCNVARNAFGEFKITDPEFMSQEGSYQDLAGTQEQLLDLF